MRALGFLVSFLVLNSIGIAADTDNPMIEGSCGDHWFKVTFKANERTKDVELKFSGDSGAEAKFTGTLVKEDGDSSFQINFKGESKGYLYIDGTDHYHNIYWGTLSRTGRPEDSIGLGLCSVSY